MKSSLALYCAGLAVQVLEPARFIQIAQPVAHFELANILEIGVVPDTDRSPSLAVDYLDCLQETLTRLAEATTSGFLSSFPSAAGFDN